MHLREMFPALPDEDWCKCLSKQTPGEAFHSLTAELGELVHEPSRDELSDVAFGIGRLLGSLTRSKYRRVPFARLHIAKISVRMEQHGCVRSARHLVDGRCPSS